MTVQNAAALPAGVAEQLVTPEGATIQIGSDVTGWTAQQIYDLLKANAYQLALIGPHLTVKAQTPTSSWTSTSAGISGGLYTYFRAKMYLDAAAGTVFSDRPDDVVAHEYGHAWTLYRLFLTQQDDWTPYLTERGLHLDEGGADRRRLPAALRQCRRAERGVVPESVSPRPAYGPRAQDLVPDRLGRLEHDKEGGPSRGLLRVWLSLLFATGRPPACCCCSRPAAERPGWRGCRRPSP